jgi:hypothetical protein
MATEAEGQSLSELERQAEHTRADLIHTVDALHNRVSPQTIKHEIRAYARETSQGLIHNLERWARENPLQIVAVAAGLAYPAWRSVSNIPAPILLIGGGHAVSQVGGRPRQAMSGDQGGEQLTDTVKRSVQNASSQMADTVNNVKERAFAAAGEATAAGMSGVSELSARAGAAINDATASVKNTAAESLAARQTAGGAAARPAASSRTSPSCRTAEGWPLAALVPLFSNAETVNFYSKMRNQRIFSRVHAVTT